VGFGFVEGLSGKGGFKGCENLVALLPESHGNNIGEHWF